MSRFTRGQILTAAQLSAALTAVTGPIPADYGAVVNGTTDDRDAVQAVIDYSAASNVTVSIPDGDYLIGSALYARSGARVVCSPRARLLRGASQTGTTGLLMNEIMTAEVTDFRWIGGTFRNPTPASLTGNMICLNADDSLLDGVRVDEWGANDRAMLLFGDRLTVREPWAVSALDGGGIRYAGGDDFLCVGGYVECGDDCFQFVPPGGPTATLFDQTIRRGLYVGCRGYSTNARLMVAALLHTSYSLHMTGSILDSGWIGVRGRGRQALTIENEDSTGSIARMFATECQCDSTGESGASTASVYISRASGAGAVEDITLRLRVLAPELEAIKVIGASGYPVGRVIADGCYFGASRTSGRQALLAQSVTEYTSRGSTYVANGSHAAQMGNGTALATNSTFSGDLFTAIDNSMSGINFACATGGAVRDARFVERSGQTTARAITLGTGAEGTGAVKIDIDAGSCDFSGITLSDPLTMNSTVSNETRVVNSGTRVHTGSLTLRRHESGQVRIANSGSALTFSLPAAAVGLEYVVTVNGSGGCVLQAASGDIIRVGSSTSTAAGTATGAQGNSIRLVCPDADTWLAVGTVGTWTLA